VADGQALDMTDNGDEPMDGEELASGMERSSNGSGSGPRLSPEDMTQLLSALQAMAAPDLTAPATRAMATPDGNGHSAGGEPESNQTADDIRDVLAALADGDFYAELENAPDDYVEVAEQVMGLSDRLQGLVAEMANLTSAIIGGELDVRTDVGPFQGGWLEVLTGMNYALDAVTHPIRATITAMGQVAQGDLTATIEDTFAGDYALLRGGFVGMVAGLRSMTEQMREASLGISSSSTDIATSTNQMATMAEQSAAAAEEISSMIEQIRSSAERVSRQAQGVADDAVQASQEAEVGSSSVQEVIDGMADIRKRMEFIGEHVNSLSERTLQAGEIINTVTEIADQSRILALNAAIQAAHAGEAGRGFRVVADEVRNLAGQSRQAADQVKSILSDIRSGTNHAMKAADEGAKGVENGVDLVRHASETIDGLAAHLKAAADASQEIVAGTQQQSMSLDQIAVGMADINEATQQTAKGAQQVDRTARDLGELADLLNAIVEQYRL